MPSPTTSLATQRPDLDTFEEFDAMMDAQDFIGQRVLPVMSVARQAGSFGRIPLEQLLKFRETRRASGAGYNRGNFTFDTESYATEEHGLEEPVDDREAEMYADYFSAEQISAVRAMRGVIEAQERRVSDLVFNATTWTGASLTTGVTNEWDDAVNATPVEDVEGAVRHVYKNSGLWPNALIINRLVFRNLRLCEQIIDRISSSGAGDQSRQRDVTIAQLQAVFDLPFIIVAGGTKDIANEGQPRDLEPIWSGEYAMVARICVTNDMREPGLGRIFHWASDGSQPLGRFETYREEQNRSEIVRVRHDVQEKILYKECAHLLSNITT